MLISPIIIPGVAGAFLCALDHPFFANCIWSVSNLLMAWHSYSMGDLTSATSFMIFQLFALYGVIRHLYKRNLCNIKGGIKCQF